MHTKLGIQTHVMIRLPLTILFTCVIHASSWAVDTSARTYRIGLLESMSASDPGRASSRGALGRTARAGLYAGKNLILDVVYSEGRSSAFQIWAKELIARKVDLIVVTTTPAGLAAKAATNTIPILFPMAIDPVGTDLVASLARLGGNATGISMVSVELSGKRLELLKELTPRLSQLGVLLNPTNAGNARIFAHTEEAAHRLGIVVKPHPVSSLEDFPRAFAAIARQHPDALLFFPIR